MHTPHKQTRRAFIVNCAAVGCIAATATGCSGPAGTDRKLVLGSLADALREVERLGNATALNPAASWTWSKTLLHCAQSIDYSMSGYPESKPAWFQHTVGSVAFSFFKSRGRMSHNLLEAVPGGASLDANAAGAVALAALRKSIDTFQKHTGPFHPHFAYGQLSGAEYEQAHAMHIANHLSAFDLTAPHSS